MFMVCTYMCVYVCVCIRLAVFIVHRSTSMTEGQPVTSAKLNGACAGPNDREGKLDRYIFFT